MDGSLVSTKLDRAQRISFANFCVVGMELLQSMNSTVSTSCSVHRLDLCRTRAQWKGPAWFCPSFRRMGSARFHGLLVVVRPDALANDRQVFGKRMPTNW